MQANWSLILNVLLLVGVIVAIGRLMKSRRQSLSSEHSQPSLGTPDQDSYDIQNYQDDIISVRKVNLSTALENEMKVDSDLQLFDEPRVKSTKPCLMPEDEENEIELKITPQKSPRIEVETAPKIDTPPTLMMFLLAKENRQFAGYELLQTVLAAGLRFGEGHLFHRHQFSNGQGPVLCSLAAATATGIFDLQNIGAFSVRGLCLYMHSSKNASVDIERFAVMLETARQLSEGLDAHLLDDQRKPLTEDRIARYHRLLQGRQHHFEFAAV